MTLQVWLAISAVVLSVGSGILGWLTAQAFWYEERMSMQLENISMRGRLDAEAIRFRALEKQARELQAALHHKQILQDAMLKPAAQLLPVKPIGVEGYVQHGKPSVTDTKAAAPLELKKEDADLIGRGSVVAS